MIGTRAGCAMLAAILLAGSAALADTVREAVEARALERSAALEETSRADYVALVMRVYDGWVDRHGYYETGLVGFEIAEAALRRIEQDRTAAVEDDEAYRTALLSALESGEIRVSGNEITLADPARAANYVWRNLGARLSAGLGEGSIEVIRAPGRRRPSGYRALDATGRALLAKAVDPEPGRPRLPDESAVSSEMDWRTCVDAGRLRPRLLERYAQQARSTGLEGSAAASYAECLSDRVIGALEEHDRAPSSRFPPVSEFGGACRQQISR